MGESDTYQSIGRIDSKEPRGAAAGPADGPADGSAESSTGAAKSHGDIVVDAISGPMRVLMAGVIVGNLALGAWWVQRTDFSNVHPQGATEEAPGTSPEMLPPDAHRLLHGLPMAAAESRLETDNRSAMFSPNDRQ